MSASLDNAISQLQEEVDSYQAGVMQNGKAILKENSVEWFLCRAQTLALSYLKRVAALSIESDPAACERLYRQHNKTFKIAEVPPPVEVEKEVAVGR